MKQLIAALIAAVVLILLNSFSATVVAENSHVIGAGGHTSPTFYEGLTLTWREEFSGRIADESNWSHRGGHMALRDGYLVLAAGTGLGHAPDATTVTVHTAGKREFRVGRIDVRARAAEGQSALVKLMESPGNASARPAVSRVDVMQLTADPGQQNLVHGTIHWREESGERFETASLALPSGAFSDQFHVFSVIWDQQGIHWLVDGFEYQRFETQVLGLGEASPALALGISLETGNDPPGTTSADPSSTRYLAIDYIRVFQFN